MNEPNRHERLQKLFEAARQVQGDEREKLLEETCAGDDALLSDVRRLLDAAEVTSDLLADDAINDGKQFELPPIDESMPQEIGNCRIIRQLGAGGMGIVWEAEQDEPRRRVALKVLAGFATESKLRRFRRESDALAMLRHPGIAQVYDSGVDTAPGRITPYIIMEYVDGKPLIEYADSNGLAMRERLELAALVCEAVEHAHQKGVIHRDLKPANILVDTAGQPRVLDFGIARMTDSDLDVTRDTQAGQLVGTIAYMSPEQAGGEPAEIDTRSDVYGLGVVIYELLAGDLPYNIGEGALLEAVRLIREEDPARLSSVDTRFRGDVETILAKSLEKEKSRRYQSAGEFAEDIRRHLTDQPIIAHPPSVVYQLKKFTKRNKLLVTSAALIFLALLTGFVATGIALQRESIQRDRAESALVEANESLAKATASSQFLESVLLSITPQEAAGRDTELLELVLDQAARSIETDLADHPAIKAQILVMLGRVNGQISQFEASKSNFVNAQEIYAGLYEDTHPARLDTALHYSATLRYAGEIEKAISVIDTALEAADTQTIDAHAHSDYLTERGRLSILEGNYDNAFAFAQQAIDVLKNKYRTDDIAETLVVRGSASRRLGNYDAALADLTAAIKVFEADPERYELQLMNVLNSLAILKRSIGDLEGAEELYYRAIDTRLALGQTLSPELATLHNNLARVLLAQDDLDRAEDAIREGTRLHLELFGSGHFGTAISIATYAEILGKREKYDEAQEKFAEALHMFETIRGDDHPSVAALRSNQSEMLINAGRYEEAKVTAQRALEISDARQLPASTFRVPILYRLAQANHGLGQEEEALRLIDSAVAELDDDDQIKLELPNKFRLWISTLNDLDE